MCVQILGGPQIFISPVSFDLLISYFPLGYCSGYTYSIFSTLPFSNCQYFKKKVSFLFKDEFFLILLYTLSNNEAGISTVPLKVQPVEVGNDDLFFKFYLVVSTTL